MGYRGKVREQEEARRLRAEGKTLLEIATTLNVAKSSASTWVRDVPFTPSPRRTGPHRRRHPFHDAKVRRIAELTVIGRHFIGEVSDDAFLVAGVALYAGEGSKRDRLVQFANSDPAMIRFFCRWLREVFEIDETRLRARCLPCTTASISTPPRTSGQRSPRYLDLSSRSRIAWSRTQRFGATSMSTAARASTMGAQRCTDPSWGLCEPCYLQ